MGAGTRRAEATSTTIVVITMANTIGGWTTMAITTAPPPHIAVLIVGAIMMTTKMIAMRTTIGGWTTMAITTAPPPPIADLIVGAVMMTTKTIAMVTTIVIPPLAKSRGGEHGNGGLMPRKCVWPSHFKSSNASFIFDARSGMFYEPSSSFFYDPKPKLYYSNSRRQYYCYDADKRPYVFQPISIPAIAPDTMGLGGKGSEMPNLATTTMKITISLKTPLPPKDPTEKSRINTTIIEKAKLNQKNAQR
jgi:hypothetical protein